MTTATITRATNYQEAYDRFVTWHPKTLKRKGANGMTFDYLPVQNYEHFLDETVAPENWESSVTPSNKAVAVTLSVFGIRKSSSSTIQPTSGKGQDNETEKAEARAFRRAAAKHGLLRYLWEKDTDTSEDEEDERLSHKPSTPSKSGKSSGSGTGLASPGQVSWLTKPVEEGGFGVPKAIATKLTAGREGTASALIDGLKKAKADDEEAFEGDPERYITRILKKIAPSLLNYMDEEDDDDDED